MIVGIQVRFIWQIVIVLNVEKKCGGLIVTKRNKKGPERNDHKNYGAQKPVNSVKLFVRNQHHSNLTNKIGAYCIFPGF